LAYVVGELEEGTAGIDRALALNPNLAMAWLFSGWARVYLGQPELAIEHLLHVMRLSPLDRFIHGMQAAMAYAHFYAGRYDEACSWLETALRERPDFVPAVRMIAASNALAGRAEKAKKACARLQQLDPALRISNFRDGLAPYRRPEDLAKMEEGLRKAGLPE
jgi:tetratricopeptide (TPR) repeat protein